MAAGAGNRRVVDLPRLILNQFRWLEIADEPEVRQWARPKPRPMSNIAFNRLIFPSSGAGTVYFPDFADCAPANSP